MTLAAALSWLQSDAPRFATPPWPGVIRATAPGPGLGSTRRMTGCSVALCAQPVTNRSLPEKSLKTRRPRGRRSDGKAPNTTTVRPATAPKGFPPLSRPHGAGTPGHRVGRSRLVSLGQISAVECTEGPRLQTQAGVTGRWPACGCAGHYCTSPVLCRGRHADPSPRAKVPVTPCSDLTPLVDAQRPTARLSPVTRGERNNRITPSAHPNAGDSPLCASTHPRSLS